MAVPAIKTAGLTSPQSAPSALKSPRAKDRAAGVRFDGDETPRGHADPYASPPPMPATDPQWIADTSPGQTYDSAGRARSPRAGGSEQGNSVARKQRAMALSPPAGPAGMGPLSHVKATPATIAARLTVLHGMLVASPDVAPMVKKRAHKLLVNLDRALVPTTRGLTEAQEKREAEDKQKAVEKKKKDVGSIKGRTTAESTADRLARKKREEEDSKKRQERLLNVKVGRKAPTVKSGGGGGAGLTASALRKVDGPAGGAKSPTGTSTPPPGSAGDAAGRDPLAASETLSGVSSLSNMSARNRKKLREQACQRSWGHLAKLASKDLSKDELKLLSLATVRSLMKHYGIDRDPIEVANIELQWRNHAQQREDDRHKNSVMHKSCEAASDKNKTQAARAISKTFDKGSTQRP